MTTADKQTVTLKSPIYHGDGIARIGTKFPDPPPWRSFAKPKGDNSPLEAWQQRASRHLADPDQINSINLALHLHRPVLVTGSPGSGKTSLAFSIAYELGLARPLVWAINSRSSLGQGLYQYDAVGRMRTKDDSGSEAGIVGRYLRLAPLGAALAASTSEKPCVLLIDEIDKGDIDLPNDLLHAFEEGRFEIPELRRLPDPKTKVNMPDGLEKIEISDGIVQCRFFPIITMTSNGERDFPPAFHRRCIPLQIEAPTTEKLLEIIARRLDLQSAETYRSLVEEFVKQRTSEKVLATDQLLNAIQLIERGELEPSFEQLQQLGLLKFLS